METLTDGEIVKYIRENAKPTCSLTQLRRAFAGRVDIAILGMSLGRIWRNKVVHRKTQAGDVLYWLPEMDGRASAAGLHAEPVLARKQYVRAPRVEPKPTPAAPPLPVAPLVPEIERVGYAAKTIAEIRAQREQEENTHPVPAPISPAAKAIAEARAQLKNTTPTPAPAPAPNPAPVPAVSAVSATSTYSVPVDSHTPPSDYITEVMQTIKAVHKEMQAKLPERQTRSDPFMDKLTDLETEYADKPAHACAPVPSQEEEEEDWSELDPVPVEISKPVYTIHERRAPEPQPVPVERRANPDVVPVSFDASINIAGTLTITVDGQTVQLTSDNVAQLRAFIK